MRKLLSAYGAGSFAAIVALIVLWMCGNSGLFGMVNSTMTLKLSLPLVCATLAWGGIWGFALILPGINHLNWPQGGLLLGLFPAAAFFLYFYPHHGWGWFGLNYGWGTALITIVGNLLWGWVTVLVAANNN
jgi:hypothetical protein